MSSLQEIRGTEQGRVFIVGSGPSLLRQNLKPLAVEKTFGCNRLTQWDGLPFTPTYYSCSASMVKMGREPADPPVQKEKFLFSYDPIGRAGWITVIKSKAAPMGGTGDSLEAILTGGSSALLMGQMAAWLGFTSLYFLGIEQKRGPHCYGDEAPFHPAPDASLLPVWQGLKCEFEAHGIQVRDCTPSGRLNDTLGYVPLEEALNAR